MDVETSLDNGVLTITLNRPEHGNAATDEMAQALTDALRGAESMARLAVLRGNGPDFCAGRALMGTRPVSNAEALSRRRDNEVIFQSYSAFRECNIPIVGVVQGKALGFGCALATLCDITLAANTSTFQIPEMNHKILPTMVMSALVGRVAEKQMQYLVFTRVLISAERALALNMINESVPGASLETRLSEVLADLSVVPKAALLGVKEYARSAYDMPTRGAIDFARNLHATVNSSVSELR